nr:hypothetical protein [Tanacetum cinerariifolium]
GTGVRVSRGGGKGRGPREGNDERIDELNSQGNDQGLGANGGVDGVNGNVEGVNRGVGGAPDFSMIIAQQLQNLLPVMLAQEYDGKGGAVVLTRWIKKMESMQDMSGCSIGQKVKYIAGSFMEEFCPSHEMKKLETKLRNHAMVEAGHTAYADRFNELARNGSIKKVEKRGNMGEPSKDKNGRDDNKRTRTGNAFASTANPVGRENTACPGLNRAEGPEGNRPNQVAANNGGQVRGNQGNQARGRAFMLGAEEACQDPNIVMGIELSELGFRYEIEIANRQLVEIDKVIKGCKLEIEGHVFDINLIPFGHGSFDLIIGMDWLSNHKAEIICLAK